MFVITFEVFSHSLFKYFSVLVLLSLGSLATVRGVLWALFTFLSDVRLQIVQALVICLQADRLPLLPLLSAEKPT